MYEIEWLNKDEWLEHAKKVLKNRGSKTDEEVLNEIVKFDYKFGSILPQSHSSSTEEEYNEKEQIVKTIGKNIIEDDELSELMDYMINFRNKLEKKYAEKELADYKTYLLSRELQKREHIQSIFVEPYGKATIIVKPEHSDEDNIILNVDGCATIIIDRV